MHLKNLKTGIIALVFGGLGISLHAQQENPSNRRGQKPPTFKQLLKQMDTNEDGKLSKEEIKGPLKNDFEKVDLDEDGFITEKEFKKAPKPKRDERNNN